jgi:hypothetical protein
METLCQVSNDQAETILGAFHNAIKNAIPRIIELLEESDLDVRSGGENAIGKLAEQRM